MNKKFQIESEEKYLPLIHFLEKELPEKRIFLLTGDLGAGKTTFVKKFLSDSLHSSENVTSPTYQLINEYEHGDEKGVSHGLLSYFY